MRTLIKTLIFVCWLLGAGVGISAQWTAPADRPAAVRYAVAEGLHLSVHDDRVALHIEGRVLPGRLSLAAAVPSAWTAFLTGRSVAPASSSARTASVAHSHRTAFRITNHSCPP